jgi:hypothetical protein
MFGTGNGLLWYVFALSFRSKETGTVFESRQTDPQISWVTPVTSSSLGDWGVDWWHLPLLGGLPFHFHN